MPLLWFITWTRGSALCPWPRAGRGAKPLRTQRGVGVSSARPSRGAPAPHAAGEPCNGRRRALLQGRCSASQQPWAHSGFLLCFPEKPLPCSGSSLQKSIRENIEELPVSGAGESSPEPRWAGGLLLPPWVLATTS